ncbi:biopolymer transporter ExbD [Methyloversatilis sp.]|uniref:ExbD/TolR family protein n=1 Tax=Methyloversatilis sp. TaxID=2569862 RepID=UPI00273748DC|nr:biopolymer transporter ExbD [Methyloversatilis sp.]MDP2868033.1 biopolymer transporter ExbD [Methyloversatilis sp.]MDP3290364.1 biopolymer transporter ExbD [Methyloversatilis sp.]MDP3454968.1 biopolymer transporter ExbD [Methyloversatilis sp.]MDP3576892.1 biopolymer transporter ExbD [Methyloversatilis sp.]
MAFASFEQEDDGPMAEINMIPLIDVMLVLLIIFMVTAPLLTHAVKVDLPKESTSANELPPENIQIAIGADEQLFWSGEKIDKETLKVKLQEAAARDKSAEIQLRADQNVPYRSVAYVMSEAARLGLTRIGFVTDPSSAK